MGRKYVIMISIIITTWRRCREGEIMKQILKKTIALWLILSLILLGTVHATAATSLAKVTVSVKQTGKTTAVLSWKKISGADGYEVYRKTGAAGTYKKIKTITNGNTVKYSDTKLTLGKKYYYKVRAYDKTSSSTVKGKFSSVKTVTLTNMKPVFTVYLPTSINKSKETIVITLTNNTKSDSCYIDGAFAIEDLNEGGKVYNAKIISYERPESNVKGEFSGSKRLTIKPGEKIRLTCKLDSSFDYDRTKVQLTTCVRYKQKDYVSVYSTKEKNRIFTAEEYYDYLMGED